MNTEDRQTTVAEAVYAEVYDELQRYVAHDYAHNRALRIAESVQARLTASADAGREPTAERLRCDCYAPTGERCPYPATQEDGLCDVCRNQPCPAWRDDDV